MPDPLSLGTCQTSSMFVARVFRLKAIEARVVQGNDPSQTEGYFHCGQWHGHAWVEALGYIVDVTGDQFDGSDVIVTGIGSELYKAGSDTASLEARRKRVEFVDAAFSEWCRLKSNGS